MTFIRTFTLLLLFYVLFTIYDLNHAIYLPGDVSTKPPYVKTIWRKMALQPDQINQPVLMHHNYSRVTVYHHNYEPSIQNPSYIINITETTQIKHMPDNQQQYHTGQHTNCFDPQHQHQHVLEKQGQLHGSDYTSHMQHFEETRQPKIYETSESRTYEQRIPMSPNHQYSDEKYIQTELNPAQKLIHNMKHNHKSDLTVGNLHSVTNQQQRGTHSHQRQELNRGYYDNQESAHHDHTYQVDPGVSQLPPLEKEIKVFDFHYPPRPEEIYPFNKEKKPYTNMAFEQCPSNITGQVVYLWSCSQFLNCWKGRGFIQNCAPGTLFNPETLECDFPYKVNCISGTHTQKVRTKKHEESGTKELCQPHFAGLLPHPDDCTKFVNCANGQTFVQDCGPGTIFNSAIQACDFPYNTDCHIKSTTESETENPYVAPEQYVRTSTKEFDGDISAQPTTYTQQIYSKPASASQVSHQWTSTGYLPTLRQVQNQYDANKKHFADEHNYKYDGQNYFDVYGSNKHESHGRVNTGNVLGSTDKQQNINHSGSRCGSHDCTRQLTNPNQNIAPDQKPSGSGHYIVNYHQFPTGQQNYTQTYYTSQQGSKPQLSNQQHTLNVAQAFYTESRQDGSAETGRPEIGRAETQVSDYSRGYYKPGEQHKQNTTQAKQYIYKQNTGQNVTENIRIGRTGPAQQPVKCPQSFTGLLPHPYICEKFLNCANGGTFIQDCGPGTVFNPDSKVCDWPYNVKCTTSSQPQTTPSSHQVTRVTTWPPSTAPNLPQQHWIPSSSHSGPRLSSPSQDRTYSRPAVSQNGDQITSQTTYVRQPNTYQPLHTNVTGYIFGQQYGANRGYKNQSVQVSSSGQSGYQTHTNTHTSHIFGQESSRPVSPNQQVSQTWNATYLNVSRPGGVTRQTLVCSGQTAQENRNCQNIPYIIPINRGPVAGINIPCNAPGTQRTNCLPNSPGQTSFVQPTTQGEGNYYNRDAVRPTNYYPEQTNTTFWSSTGQVSSYYPIHSRPAQELTPPDIRYHQIYNYTGAAQTNPETAYTTSSQRPIYYYPGQSRPPYKNTTAQIPPISPTFHRPIQGHTHPAIRYPQIYNHPGQTQSGGQVPNISYTRPSQSQTPTYPTQEQIPILHKPSNQDSSHKFYQPGQPAYQESSTKRYYIEQPIEPTYPNQQLIPVYKLTPHYGSNQGQFPVRPEKPQQTTAKPVTQPSYHHSTIRPPPAYDPSLYEQEPGLIKPTKPTIQNVTRHWPPPFPSTDTSADYYFEDAKPTVVKTSKPKWKSGGKCAEDEFECSKGQCIPTIWLCDGNQDCSNGLDEKNCSIYLEHFTVMPSSRLYKHEIEKWLNTDLQTCANYCLNSKNFQCKSFNFRRQDNVCLLCNTNVGLSGAIAPSNQYDYYEMKKFSVNCSNLYQCSNKKCINYTQVCDGNDDCGNRMDEKSCSAEALGYEIRLAGSKLKHEGRIEVKIFNEWGYVCDDQFGLRDAEVVCKELGFYQGALQVKSSSHFAKDISDNETFYLMDDVSCFGNETSLRNCDFSGWGVHNCMPQEIAGVICKTQQESCPVDHWKCDTNDECIPLQFLCDITPDCTDRSDEASHHCEAPIEIRVANGTTKSEGRVELRYHGVWGTICDDDFTDQSAKVVCKSLGYDGSAVVKKEGAFGAGGGPIWLDQVSCAGNESSLEECLHWNWGDNNCDHNEDVGVVCSHVDTSEYEKVSKSKDVIHMEPISPPAFDSLYPIKCGHRGDDLFLDENDESGVHFRVVKGSTATRGAYPWQATIRVKGKTKSSHWCGAVIITNKWVLTAAHCLVGFSKGSYIVRAGDYNVDENEGTEVEAFIEDFYIHERFRQGGHMNNDIALIRLKGAGLHLSKQVQPICLPEKDAVYEDGMNCTISGFGSTESGKSSSSHILRAGWVPIKSEEVCKSPHVYNDSITAGMFCAGYLDEGVDSCDGDSGGPLACLDKGLFTLYGLTSWGQRCGHSNKPGVYVKVSYYREWIDKKIQEAS